MNDELFGIFPALLIHTLLLAGGVVFIWRSLCCYVSSKTAGVTTFLIAAGTNLFYLGISGDQLQPVILFFLCSALIYFTILWHNRPTVPAAVIAGLAFALICLFQATGYFALTIPVFWSGARVSAGEKISFLKKNPRYPVVFFVVIAVITLFMQLSLNALPGEIPAFNLKLPGIFTFGSKHLWNDLFSFDHGWLIYTPLLIIPATGFYILAEKQVRLFRPLFLFCLVEMLSESCWTNRGDTPVFGQVAFTALYPVLAFPAATFIEWLMNRGILIRIAIFTVITSVLLLNLFQTWQFRAKIIPVSNTTCEAYCMAFGHSRLTKTEAWRMLEITGEDAGLPVVMKVLEKRILVVYDFERGSWKNLVSANPGFGGRAIRMDTGLSRSPGMDISYSCLLHGQRGILRISADFYAAEPVLPGDVKLVIKSTHGDKNYRCRELDVGSILKPGKRQTISFDYLTPVGIEQEDRVEAFVNYSGKKVILVDNIEIDLFE